MGHDLRGKTIVITGASAGIGEATAWACAKAGMDVVLAARRTLRLESLARQMVQAGHRAAAVTCDVASDADVQRLVDTTMATFGRLDVMFANAGYGLFSSVLETTEAQMRDIWEINFFGTIRCIKAAAPVMVKSGSGHVLICSSAASKIGLPMYGHYAATKAAQESIASALRAELADSNVHVSSVHPIGTRTEFWQVAGKSAAAEGSGGLNTPQMFMQTPQRVAREIVRCLRRPRPEVWPSLATRLGLALATAWPSIGVRAMRQLMQRQQRDTAE